MVNEFVMKPIEVKHGNSCVYNINYHIVFCPKYRKKILTKEIKADMETIFKSICEGNDWKIIELNIQPDHIHLFLSLHPKTSPMVIVKKLKGISARLIFKKYPIFQSKKYSGRHLWSGGYYIGTAGVVTKEAIEKYIRANSSNL